MYCSILKEKMLPSLHALVRRAFFQHDNDPKHTSNGAFPLHGTVRFGTARYGTVRLSSGRFAFPPQFSTAIEWAGLFTRRYNCAASTAVTSS